MSEGTKHTEGVVANQFCAIRKANCGHAKYKKVCKPSWSYMKYPQKKTQRKESNIAGQIVKLVRELTNWRSYEAHHIACVASVSKILVQPDDPEKNINVIVSQTKWCINKKHNMIALPMWAHSLMWYCSVETGEIESVEQDGEQQPKKAVPPFENLPQHDYDHAKYIAEVDDALSDIVREVQENKKDHKASQEDFETALNNTVDFFQSELKRRGARNDGTHEAWKAGLNGSADWYMPFSMADDDEVTARTFPTRGGTKMLEKIQAMVEAYWKDGKWRAE